jgi:hypothetical protein
MSLKKAYLSFRIGLITPCKQRRNPWLLQARKSREQRDTVYDLASILYHALQGAETYGMYIADAEQVGDTELVKFFQEVQEEERQRADRAKRLLADRLGS